MLKISHALRPRGRVGWGGVGLGKGGLWVNALVKNISCAARCAAHSWRGFRPTHCHKPRLQKMPSDGDSFPSGRKALT